MNALEAQLHYPFGDTLPAAGCALEVAPGVKWLRMGLPFALDHINLWLLRDHAEGPEGVREGWAIVDCGITDDATRASWEQVFATALEGLPVLRVIVTHMHPDHIGLAHWLTERWQCPLWISATDWNAARLASQSTTGFGGEAAARHFATHGLNDPASIDKIRRRANYYAAMVPAVPDRYHRLMGGRRLRIGGQDWRCLAGYGHAPEHIALYREGGQGGQSDQAGDTASVLISGDMVLPRISTNVSVIDLEPEGDPLTLYLESIEALRPLAADTLVLPSHGRPFGGVTPAVAGEGAPPPPGTQGLHARIDQLQAHHAERFKEVLATCATAPTSAAELLPVLFKRPLDLHQTTFAMGEAIAHLHALWFQGRLKRLPGADGVLRFTLA
jgi:glyoxylase-like metal-dependent hydrolase (beta-lactamase superfamily II)